MGAVLVAYQSELQIEIVESAQHPGDGRRTVADALEHGSQRLEMPVHEGKFPQIGPGDEHLRLAALDHQTGQAVSVLQRV